MAVRFDADTEDYSTNPTVNTSSFTVTCWVRIDVDRNTFSTAWNVDDGGTTTLFLLQTNADGVTWNVADETSGDNIFVATVGVWYYIAVTKGPVGASNTTAYWAAANAAGLSSATLTRGTDFTVATSQIGESIFTGEWLNGSIAAVKCWESKLTQAEVEAERFQMYPHRTSNLIWFYPFLEGGATAGARQDFSGNGFNLSGGTGSATTDGPPIPWNQGRRRTRFPTIAGSTPDPGGYWQLEENTDRWQLEDGSGLWLLENTAGDLRFPAWSPWLGPNTLIRM